jgi:hypothetical protein
MALLTAAGIGLAAVVALPGPAGAHTVFQGDDYVQHSYDATQFLVCDAEDDSHSVWAGHYDNSSNSYKTADVFYPSNPDGVNCTLYDIYPLHLTNVRAVEDNPSSSANYYGPWHGYPVAGT